MSVYWVRTDSDNALEAMAAVERALHGDPSAVLAPPAHIHAASDDSYLAENIAILQATWSVDHDRIVESSRPYAAWAINRLQRLVRRATWWYVLPQWSQISEFHGAVVRVLEVLLAQQRQLDERLAEVEAARAQNRTQALEQQLQSVYAEQQALQNRIAELEAQVQR